ncbi:MAG TPA: hypothetical protein VKT82_34865 [Ktedonobacterales bacterium]|nr:hypothetical protein [Ktedonobacterales bacterium]
MRARWLFSLLGTLALVFTLNGSAPSLADPFYRQTIYNCDDSGSSAATGAAAIQPHLRATPSFTADDVRHYLKQHGVLGADGPFTILKILFITSREACQRTQGEDIGLDANALVCFVELKGTFYPFLYIDGSQPSSPYAAEVFDAQTGNLLMIRE